VRNDEIRNNADPGTEGSSSGTEEDDNVRLVDDGVEVEVGVDETVSGGESSDGTIEAFSSEMEEGDVGLFGTGTDGGGAVVAKVFRPACRPFFKSAKEVLMTSGTGSCAPTGSVLVSSLSSTSGSDSWISVIVAVGAVRGGEGGRAFDFYLISWVLAWH
jgi:hypothetical protein